VNPDDPLLDKEAIAAAFRRLGDRLAWRGLVADVYVFGGAAMALAYDARRATRDIDAVFEPHGVVVEEARVVAEELGLPPWWLNEQASAYVAPGGDPGAPRILRADAREAVDMDVDKPDYARSRLPEVGCLQSEYHRGHLGQTSIAWPTVGESDKHSALAQ
jgi:hypothetical protein